MDSVFREGLSVSEDIGQSYLCRCITSGRPQSLLAKGPRTDSAAGKGSSSVCLYAFFPCLAGTVSQL